jgi:DAK2 domain fusion protein YloV
MTSTKRASGASGDAAKQASGRTHQHVPSGPGELWSGQDLKRAVTAATAWLTRNAEAINAINVFPVPDGDTGTNMALTMQSAIKQVADSPGHSAAEMAAGISRGALMGARGNSGVILSQVWRGFAEGIGSKESISARDFAEGLVAATAMAYRAVLKPVEGTILTVMREMGEAARAAASTLNSYGHVLAETSVAARASVDRTPSLNEKLRDAGVVDSGGQGLFVLLDGMRRYAEGEEIDALEVAEATGPLAGPHEGPQQGVHVEHGEYGYCTNFLIVGGGWDFDEVKARIASLGESAVIVGDDDVVKVHIHTEAPGTVLNYATTLGSLRQITITNMQDQHEDFLEMHAQDNGHVDAAGMHSSGRGSAATTSQSRIAVLAVASGQGLVETFKSMGATAIIEGGQTMNPSTEQLLKIIEGVPQNEVILLPNNSNILMAARQTTGLTKKRVAVVPTDTIPQGMAALIAYNFVGTLEENVEAMQEAASQVETGEITRAVRDARVNDIDVKSGSFIGLHNNALVTTGPDPEEVAWDLLERMGAAKRELITIYWGSDVTASDAEAFCDKVQERYPTGEVELVNGGQPFYEYIISAE